MWSGSPAPTCARFSFSQKSHENNRGQSTVARGGQKHTHPQTQTQSLSGTHTCYSMLAGTCRNSPASIGAQPTSSVLGDGSVGRTRMMDVTHRVSTSVFSLVRIEPRDCHLSTRQRCEGHVPGLIIESPSTLSTMATPTSRHSSSSPKKSPRNSALHRHDRRHRTSHHSPGIAKSFE